MWPLLLVIALWWWLTMIQWAPDDWGFDFRQFWRGGVDVLAGDSPYPTAALLRTAHDDLDPTQIQHVFRFPYPAGSAVLLAPFGALSFQTAMAVWGLLAIAALLGAVLLLGVRDWRVFAVVITSAPLITSVRLGTLTPILLLLLAVAWRWRDRRFAPGAAIGIAISLKLFVWPIVVWLAATRRWREAGVAALSATGVTLAAWAAIGFDGLALYPELVRRLTDVVADRGYSLVAFGVQAGLPEAGARVLPWLTGLAALTGVVVLGRRDGGDRAAFSLGVIACLALTPIVWLHYFALLVVPLALSRPRIAWPWFLLWAFWLTADQGNSGDLWRVALAAVLVGIVVAVGVAPARRWAA